MINTKWAKWVHYLWDMYYVIWFQTEYVRAELEPFLYFYNCLVVITTGLKPRQFWGALHQNLVWPIQGRTGQHFFGFRVGSGLDVRASGRVGFFIKNHIGFRVLHFGFRVMIRVENLESDLLNFKILFQRSDVYRNFRYKKYFQSNFDKKSSKKVEIFDFCAIFY